MKMCNTVLLNGAVPNIWRRTLFHMLAQKVQARSLDVRLLYQKILADFRTKGILEAQQPEEQHGFRGSCRLEEHLLSA